MNTESSRSIGTRNASVDCVRYLFSLLVVAFHCRLFTEYSEFFAYVTAQILARLTVPYFFCVAGYYYLKKLHKGEKPFWKYFKRLVSIYAIWSVPYWVIDFFSGDYKDLHTFFKHILVSFFINGSCYHLWFFPAILFCVAVCTLFFRMGLKKLLIPSSLVTFFVGLLCIPYVHAAERLTVVSFITGLPFFTLIRNSIFIGFSFFVSGYLVYRIRSYMFFQKYSGLIFVLSVAVWITELVLLIHFQLSSSLAVTAGMYLLITSLMNLLLEHPLAERNQLGACSRTMADFTYYSHVLVMTILSWIAAELPDSEGLTETPLFILTAILTSVIGFAIWKSDNRILKKLVNG